MTTVFVEQPMASRRSAKDARKPLLPVIRLKHFIKIFLIRIYILHYLIYAYFIKISHMFILCLRKWKKEASKTNSVNLHAGSENKSSLGRPFVDYILKV